MHRFGEWLLAKPIHAAVVALILTLLPLIGLPTDFLACIVVAFVTLRLGAKAGAYVLAWVAIPAIALLFLRAVGPFDMMLVRSIIIWVMALILRRTTSWSNVLYGLAAIGIVAVVGFHLVIQDSAAWWVARITQYLSAIAKDANIPAAELTEHARLVAQIATGTMALFLMLGVFMQLFIARFLQAAMFNPGGLRREGLNIRVSPVFGIALIALAVLSVMRVAVAIDCVPVLIMPFLVSGFSLLHMCVEQKRIWMIGLFLLYVATVLVPYVALVVALVGFLDSGVDIRRRFSLSL